MKSLLILVALVITHLGTNAQTFTWAKAFSGSSGEVARRMTLDGSGNLYVLGDFHGTVDFDPGPLVSNLTAAGGQYYGDVFIAKLDAMGNLIWARKVGNSTDEMPGNITVDNSGNVFITGLFEGTVDFDPGTGVFNLTSAGLQDNFILKLNSSGNLIWAKRFGNASVDRTTHGMDAAGNIYLHGYFTGTTDFDPGPAVFNMTSTAAPGPVNTDIFVSKLDNAGNFVWAKAVGGISDEQAIDVFVDGTGNVFGTGSYNATVDFDPGPGTANLTASGQQDTYIWKLDSAGNYSWSKSLSGNSWYGGVSITGDVAGNIYLTGYFNGTVDFDPGSAVYNLTSLNANWEDAFVEKLNASGNMIWVKRLGGTGASAICYSLSVDAGGHVYAGGAYYGTVDFDPSTATANLTSVANTYDMFLSKLDGSGNYVTTYSFGSSSPNSEGISSVKVDAGNNIYFGGVFEQTVDFDPSSASYNLTTAGQWDAVIAKFGQCTTAPSQPGAITGAANPCVGGSQTYSVSSVAGASSYIWTLPSGWTGTSTTNSITVTAGTSGGNITVAAVNSCGTSATNTLAVTVNGLPSPTITQAGNVLSAPTGFASYQWYRNSSMLPGATTQSITATQSGNYHVVVTNSNNCSGQSNILAVTITDIEIISHVDHLSVHPNPVIDKLNISINKGSLGRITIHDMEGKIVKDIFSSRNSCTLEVGGVVPGVYLLTRGRQTFLIVKQ